MGSAVQEPGLDAEDAEDKCEHAAAQVEKQLAGVHDPPAEVVEVLEHMGVIDSVF
jgi:hypothetical protein